MLKRIITLFSFVLALSVPQTLHANSIEVGASQFELYIPLLKGKRVALVVNQTSTVGGAHLVDALLAKSINVTAIFAPEHGFRGDHDAGAHVNSAIDSKTGLPIISIYGKNKQPSLEVMQQVDVVIFDIQDVGVRFYTYISSMHYMMQASAQAGVPFIVLDRPNPNIAYVDGPVLKEPFRSFVGMHPIPVLHGMTVGELAQMIVGEHWLDEGLVPELTVIPVANYTRDMAYSLPIKPSPNLPNDQAIGLYPSLCFFEATPVSIGRGTDFPFQVLGHDEVSLGEFTFSPRPIAGAASNPKLNGKHVQGLDLRQSKVRGLDLGWLIAAHERFKMRNMTFFTSADFMDKLAGTDALRTAIESGKSEHDIKQTWQADLDEFKARRAPYLLYH
ncbi:exo-beta-N-acetylmuramidase NamZ domain-containing protein [Pseudoalteromonas sp. SSDWG2]|uniref:exo-beta-N-acetylmuramidase NamZ family protein n=1 Tax=Pseudoalteromonas sp. SSDWG2 TaxID=3139391 RepID=UPI003BAAB71E